MYKSNNKQLLFILLLFFIFSKEELKIFLYNIPVSTLSFVNDSLFITKEKSF